MRARLDRLVAPFGRIAVAFVMALGVLGLPSAPAFAAGPVDLAVDLTQPVGQATAGLQWAYTLSVTNNLPNPSSGYTVSFDAIPGTSLATAPGCVDNTTTIDCTQLDGADNTFTITLDIDPSYPDGTSLNASAAITNWFGDTDAITVNDSDTASTTVQTVSDLGIVKSGPGGISPIVVAGDPAGYNYTLTVSTSGPSDNSFSVQDTLPTGLTFDSSDAGCSALLQVVTCGGTIAADDLPIAITVHVLVDPSVGDGTILDNDASVAVAAGTDDPNLSNNDTDGIGTVSTKISARADLGLTVSAPAGDFVAGAATGVDYTYTVANDGPSDNVGGFTISDTLPTGFSFTSLGSSSECSGSGTSVTCKDPSDFAQDDPDRTFTVHATIAPSVLPNTYNDAASVAPGTTFGPGTQDPNGINDTDNAGVAVVTRADLGLSVTSAPTGTVDNTSPLYAGNSVIFTVHVANNQADTPSDAAAYNFTAAVPAHTTFDQASSDCSGSAVAGSTITCASSGLLHGSTTEDFDIVLDTLADFVDTSLNNQALLSFGVASLSPTTNQGDNSEIDTPSISPSPTVTGSADLQVTQLVTQPTVAAFTPLVPGNINTIHIELTVTNVGGPSNARHVTVTDTLPVSLDSTTVTATPTSGACGAVTATVTCDLGTMAPNATRTIMIDGSVTRTLRNGLLTNTNAASVTSSPAVFDPIPGNNSATPNPTLSIPTVPDKPNIVSADPGNNQIAVVWTPGNFGGGTPNDGTGGSPITSWDIVLTPTTGPQTFVNVAGTAAGGQLTATITASNLAAGQSYSVKVEARNAAGDSTASNSIAGVAPCTTCVLRVVSSTLTRVLNTGSSAATSCPQSGIGATGSDTFVSCYQFGPNGPKAGLPLALNEGPAGTGDCGSDICIGNQRVNVNPAGEGTGVTITQYVWVDITVSTKLFGHPCLKNPCGGGNGVYVYEVFVNGNMVGTSLKNSWCTAVPIGAIGCVKSLTEFTASNGINGKAGNGDLQIILLLKGDPKISLSG